MSTLTYTVDDPCENTPSIKERVEMRSRELADVTAKLVAATQTPDTWRLNVGVLIPELRLKTERLVEIIALFDRVATLISAAQLTMEKH